jgi:hypothetical protein
MNMQDHDPQSREQRAFDEALRQRHGEAVARVSERTQAQLQQRRRAALSASASGRPRTAMRRFAWPVATSFAAIFALAVGMQLRQDSVTQASMPIATIADDDDDVGASFAALDENPDLYLWLASSDAVAFASE